MGNSSKLGVGAVVKFKLKDVIVRPNAPTEVSEWLQSTGVERHRWNVVKWRGRLTGRRRGDRTRTNNETFIFRMHPERNPPLNIDSVDVDGHEEWNTAVEIEVVHTRTAICKNGEAPLANRTWFPRRAPESRVTSAASNRSTADEASQLVGPGSRALTHRNSAVNGMRDNDYDLATPSSTSTAETPTTSADDDHEYELRTARTFQPPLEQPALVVDADSDAVSENGGGGDDFVVWDPMGETNDRSVVQDHREVLMANDGSVLNMRPQMRLSGGRPQSEMVEIDYFLHFLPKAWIENEMLPAMNETAAATLDPDPQVTFDDILQLLGVLMYYSSLTLTSFHEMWSTAGLDALYRPQCLPIGKYISRARCERVMRLFDCLRPGEREDDVHPIKGVLKMIDAFNKHFSACFMPGWATCLDKSTLVTASNRDPLKVRACLDICHTSCRKKCFSNSAHLQGYHPEKPTSSAALYHTMACGLSKVIYWMEVLIPQQYSLDYQTVEREFSDGCFPMAPKTCALVLRATQSIWHTHRLVIMDPGFTGLSVVVRT